MKNISEQLLLFAALLNGRLTQHSDENTLIKDNQIGFRKGFSISGHVFTLETITDSYLQGGQRLYVYFDFRKAYDSVWRDLYKLAKYGIIARFINSTLQPQVVCKTVKMLG